LSGGPFRAMTRDLLLMFVGMLMVGLAAWSFAGNSSPPGALHGGQHFNYTHAGPAETAKTTGENLGL
jgi:hypothetical protein